MTPRLAELPWGWILGGLALLGLFHACLARIPKQAAVQVVGALEDAAGMLTDLAGRLAAWIEHVFEEEGVPGSGRRVSYAVGAILYTALLTLFLAADYYGAFLTVQVLGFHGWLAHTVTAAFLSSVLLLGTVFLELIGVTHLAPWERAGTSARRILMGLCLVALLGSMGLAYGMAKFRAEAMKEAARADVGLLPLGTGSPYDPVDLAFASASPSGVGALPSGSGAGNGSTGPGPAVDPTEHLMIGLAVLLAVTPVFAGVGLALFPALLATAVAGVAMGGLHPGAWGLALFGRIVTVGGIFLLIVLEFPSRVGITLYRPPVTALRRLRQWVDSRDPEGSSLLSVIVHTLTDWVDDTDFPKEAIGSLRYLESDGNDESAPGPDNAEEDPAPDDWIDRESRVHETRA